MCVQCCVFENKKIIINRRNKFDFENPLTLSSQDRESQVSGLYEITVKCLRTGVCNPWLAHTPHKIMQDRDKQNTSCTNMHRSCHRFGSCFLSSLLTCRRILVVVRAQPHNPNHPRTPLPPISCNINLDSLTATLP